MKTPVVLQRFAPRAADVSSTGRTINCATAQDVQNALDAAQPGDNIVLTAGTTYQWGNRRQIMFTCRNVSGAGDTPGSWITIRSSNSNLLTPSKRVQPSDAPNMAKLVLDPTWYSMHFVFDLDAHHYRFLGLEMTVTDPMVPPNYGSLTGDGQPSTAGGMWGGIFVSPSNFTGLTPGHFNHHVVVDRCYIHVADNQMLRTPIRPECEFFSLENSWIGECKITGDESQNVGWTMGNGPYRVVNNHLGGGTEGLMPGGSDLNAGGKWRVPPVADGPNWFPMQPSDLYVAGNHFIKDLRTYVQSPNFIPLAIVPPNLTTYPVVKNGYEYKFIDRAICEANIIEYNWPAGQEGFQNVITVRNGYTINMFDNGIASSVGPNGEDWGLVDNCWYRNNIFSHTLSAINFLGCDDGSRYRGHQTKNVVIENNFLYDISGDSIFWNAGRGQAQNYNSRLFGFNNIAGVKFIRNTVLDCSGLGFLAGVPVGFVGKYPPSVGGFGAFYQGQRPEGALCINLELVENIICYKDAGLGADGIAFNTVTALNIHSPNAKFLNNGWITTYPQYTADAQGDGLVHSNFDGSVVTLMPATWVIGGSRSVANIAAAGFVNPDPLWQPGGHREPADYVLSPSSPFYAASASGGPVGCDMAQLMTAVAGCLTGDWGAQGPPSEPVLGPATIISMTPSSGMQGETVRVTLTGNLLTGGEIVPFVGVEATIVSTSNNQIVADFKIRHRARPGTRPVNVSCDNGPTNVLNFTITQAPAPIVNSLSVYQGATYTEVYVTATGQNLTWAEITNATGGFVNQPIIPYTVIEHVQFPNASDTSATFKFTIRGNTVPGVYDLYFTNGGALPAAPVVFTIVTGVPENPTTITNISPNPPPNDATTFTLTVTGQNLQDSAWSFSPPIPGVWMAGYYAPNGNTPTTSARYMQINGAPEGVYYLTLSNDLGGASNPFGLIIGAPVIPPPTLSSVSPSSGSAGASVPVTITGANLTGSTIAVSGSGVTAIGVSSTANQITATLVIDSGAAISARNLTVTTAGGTSGALSFNVTPAATQPPILASISPPTGVAGATVPVTLAGANLTGAVILVSGSGVSVIGLNSTDTQVTATFVIDQGAAVGYRDISVMTAGGTSGTVPFNVTPAPPPSTSIMISNVSVITSIPSQVLEIDGSVNIVGSPAPQYLINGVPIGSGGGGGSQWIDGANGAIYYNGGPVGIGATPQIKLDVNGHIRSIGADTPTGGIGVEMGFLNGRGFLSSVNRAIPLSNPAAYQPLQLEGNDIVLYSFGIGVGVGVINPGYALDVAGDVNITGQYRVNGTPIGTGGGGGQAQTPWAQNVDAANYRLDSVATLGIGRALRAGYFIDAVTTGGQVFTVTQNGGMTLQGSLNVSGSPGNISASGITGNTVTATVTGQIGGASQTIAVRLSWITDTANWKIEAGGSATATPGELAISNGGYVSIALGGSGQNQTIALPWLRTTAPAAGSKELWCDTANGNVVKFGA